MSERWPYRFAVLDVADLFVDETYQRPLTSFAERIKKQFDPALLGTLIASAREDGRFAIVDGQTRMAAVRDLAEAGEADPVVPCLVYEGLTQAQEADLFARLQRERRGMASYHRFRAALVSGDEEALAIQRIATDAGYAIGEGSKTNVSAVAALEKVYRRSPETLRRTLAILRAAWGDRHMPSGDVLRGLGALLASKAQVEDRRLTVQLATVTPEELKRRAMALSEGMGRGMTEKYMTLALEGVYSARLRQPEPVTDVHGPSKNCAVRSCIMAAVPGADFCEDHDKADLEAAA